MKPEYPDLHFALAQWVSSGGALVYVGNDADPYHGIRSWWNAGRSGGKAYASPREHLFELLGLAGATAGVHPSGSGAVGWLDSSPEACAASAEGAEALRRTVRETMAALGRPELRWRTKSHFMTRRGPYIAAAALDETDDDRPLAIPGPVVDLFDPALAVRPEARVAPGEQALLFDVEAGRPPEGELALLSAASRVENVRRMEDGFRFTAKGPSNLTATARWYCPHEPIAAEVVQAGIAKPAELEWDAESGTALLRYTHGSGAEAEVRVSWKIQI